jgi:hypothetical protein
MDEILSHQGLPVCTMYELHLTLIFVYVFNNFVICLQNKYIFELLFHYKLLVSKYTNKRSYLTLLLRVPTSKT